MYQHLKRYERPSHFADFADFDRGEYYVCFGQHRDSDTLTRSNHGSALAALGGESDTVRVVRDSHFLVGWVETIYVHESDTAACATADRLVGKLEDYPVLSDDDWSMLQYDEAAELWASLPVRDRVHICSRFDISPFAARRSELPDDPQGGLVEYLADGV
jgi:hypothetical protein